jgi:hypothetical protein
LEEDVAALKKFLMATPPPKSCQPPGEHTAWKCYYTLDITKVLQKDKDKGVFSGKVASSTVKGSATYCKEELVKRQLAPDRYFCTDPSNYVYREFTFTVDEGASDLMIGTIDAKFVSEPSTNHLTRIR